MNKYLSAIYRNDPHSLEIYISRRSGKDRHEINEAMQILIGDTNLDQAQRIRYAQTLLLADANPNGTDADGNPYLLNVCENEDTELSNLLVNFECDVNAANDDGTTALHMAAKVGNADLAGLLVASGADANAVDSLGETPLIRGLYFEPSDELFNILLIDADMNAVNADFETALHIAVHMNLVKEAKVLIANGADVNFVDINGNSPLHCACQFTTHVPNPEMIQLLLYSSCDPNLVTRHRLTPLHMLSTREAATESLRILLSNTHVDLEAMNELSQTPLFVAVQLKAIENIKLLLKANCDPNSKGYSTQFGSNSAHTKPISVLDLALKVGDARIVCALLIAGATDYVACCVDLESLLSDTQKSELHMLIKKPVSLKQACRCRIRACLGKRPERRILLLTTLPPAMQAFVTLQELDNI